MLAAADRRIECAWLFGSAARGDAGPLSDVDVAVLIEETATPMARLEIAAALIEELERRVARADVVIFNEAPPALRHRVIRDGILLLERDARRRVDSEVRSIREYLDFQHLADIYDRALIARAVEGRLGT